MLPAAAARGGHRHSLDTLSELLAVSTMPVPGTSVPISQRPSVRGRAWCQAWACRLGLWSALLILPLLLRARCRLMPHAPLHPLPLQLGSPEAGTAAQRLRPPASPEAGTAAQRLLLPPGEPGSAPPAAGYGSSAMRRPALVRHSMDNARPPNPSTRALAMLQGSRRCGRRVRGPAVLASPGSLSPACSPCVHASLPAEAAPAAACNRFPIRPACTSPAAAAPRGRWWTQLPRTTATSLLGPCTTWPTPLSLWWRARCRPPPPPARRRARRPPLPPA